MSRRPAAVLATTVAICASLLAALPVVASLRPGGDVVITVLSNRADLISGGDALVRVATPAGVAPPSAVIDLDGRTVTSSFAVRPDGYLEGLVSGLHTGANVLSATLPDGYGARITITDHPIGGPVFAGPQTQPWICTTSANGLAAPTDAQCDAPTVFTYHYKNAATGQFSSYDPSNPPPSATVATTTTDDGTTVPYIVRDERGTIDRGIYDVAVLFDPASPWTPWAPQKGWDHKLGFTFGGGCAPGHSQQSAQSAIDDLFLARGYMKAVSSIDVNGNSCNAETSAESLMMIKEHIAETYGAIRFTMGDGCSGGAEQQHMIAEKYPGLIDGIRPECDFPDLWTPAMWEKLDCELFTRYFNQTSPTMWANPADRAAVLGGPLTPGDCVEQTGFNQGGIGGAYQDWQADGIGCGAIGSAEYNATTNPRGTRCDLQDYNVNQLGRRPDGFANRPYDDTGVQWGLQALLAGSITPAQFVDMNSAIGSFSIDMAWQPGRSAADVAGVDNMYLADELSWGAGWALIPEIDARADDSYDEHSNVMRLIDHARMDTHLGTHATQVFWTEPSPGAFGMPSPQTHALSFTVMDQWLTNLEADHGSDPPAVRVVRARPAAAVDSCVQAGQLVAQALCSTVATPDVLPIHVAGAPLATDILLCQKKPLAQGDYPGIAFTTAQWSALRTAFPNGVCDWTRAGVGQRPPQAFWLTYATTPGGVPLGPAPVSVPFGPAVAAGDGSAGSASPNTGAARVTVPAVTGAVAAVLTAGAVARRRRRQGPRA